MCADLAGSAVPDKVETGGLSQWLKGHLEPALAGEQLEAVVRSKLQGATPRPFQMQVRDAPVQTVCAVAGCGAGKTAAAYLWASRHGAGKRLFFCYPTTATAGEGFSGYLQDPDFEAMLVHSRVSVDYRLMENLPARSPSQRKLLALKLEALDTWPIPAVVCTAHTVLGLLQNVRRGLYAWPLPGSEHLCL